MKAFPCGICVLAFFPFLGLALTVLVAFPSVPVSASAVFVCVCSSIIMFHVSGFTFQDLRLFKFALPGSHRATDVATHRSGVGLGALSSNRKITNVAGPAIRAELFQPLDVR